MTTTYADINPGPGVGQAQQCGGIKPVNGLRNLPDSLPLKKNIHYNKNEQLQKHVHVNGRVNVCL